MISLKSKAEEYINHFSNKDIIALKEMFDNNICLRDWEIDAKGIEDVLKANQKIFDDLESINVIALNLYSEENIIIAELDIFIDKNEKIKVVDIIEFNKSLKIISIKAFKG